MEPRYDFTQIEKQMQVLWEQEQLYRFDPDQPGEIYSIDTPPPTVSGSLHIGHLFSYTQAEIIARFRRMQGQNVFYPFGFDDNGLPTERLVERDAGIRANTLPRSVFIERCEAIAAKYEEEFKTLWKSLGFSVDWSMEYHTIGAHARRISQELFLELVHMGKAYTKESPVLWCTECQTSIAQAELDTKDVVGTFNYLAFYVEGNPLTVATTRPELLYGCVCLFVHPDDERYRQYIGKSATVPLYDYEIPILADEKVAIEKGTGVVMCATFGDSTDAQWVAAYQLPYRKVLLPSGYIADDVPLIGGLRIPAAREKILRLLAQKGLLYKSEAITHTVATHERCAKPVEILPSQQWYIDILSQQQRFLEAADEINWYPANMKNRYIAWVKNLKWDWCISRQRYFGVPFPVWYCKDCGKPVFATPEQLPVNPLETPYEGICACGCNAFVPERAVFDTWATSSVTPQINQRQGMDFLPMSMRTHAHEIIRTWTFYTIVRSLYHTGKLPWKDLMICGFVLAKKGVKISKSKSNNAYEPTHLIATHSADVLRYWTAGARLGTDTFFDVNDLSLSKKFMTKLWNASKFAISHLQDLDLRAQPELLPVDRWMIERTKETMQNTTRLLYQYEIGAARHEIDELFWKDFCDHYIEIVKERLYLPQVHGADRRRSGQYALYYTLLHILKMYAVYIPHMTEYIYQQFFRQYEKKVSLHQLLWEKPVAIDHRLIAFGEQLKSAVSDMRRYKSENNLSMRAQMQQLCIDPGAYLDWFTLTQQDLRACANAEEIRFI